MVGRGRWLVILLMFSLQTSAADRVALVIGNAAYSDRPLRNPGNDAEAVSALLRGLGFEVTLHRDLDIDGMDAALAAFRSRLQTTSGIGLFYFSGHGLQLDGESFLVPVGAPVGDGLQVRRRTLAARSVLKLMEESRRQLNVVILDACRDWPFAAADKSIRKGLPPIVESPAGFIIAYATGANATASDGNGQLSPYTETLIAQARRPGLSINDLFQEVSLKVSQRDPRQVPAVYASAVPRIFLAGPGQSQEPDPLPPPPPVVDPPAAAPRILHFDVTPRFVSRGKRVDVSWQAEDADHCSLTAPDQDSIPVEADSGSRKVTVRRSGTIELQCNSAAGSADASEDVKVRARSESSQGPDQVGYCCDPNTGLKVCALAVPGAPGGACTCPAVYGIGKMCR